MSFPSSFSLKAYSWESLVSSGGAVLLVLVILSVYSLALIWERWNFISGARAELERFLEKIRKPLTDNNLGDVLALCKSSKGPGPEVLLATLVGPPQKEDRRRSSERMLNQHVVQL